VSPGNRPPQSPFIYIDRHAGRPPRIFQWSFGLQREINSNLLVEAAYVGNRGVWWSAPVLQSEAYNALRPEDLTPWGLDIANAGDRALLTTQVQNLATAAANPSPTNPQLQPEAQKLIAKYPWLTDLSQPSPGFFTNNHVYSGFPATQTLNQVIRPHPQWNGVPPFLGPPLGDTWYDSLQIKVTQRFWHNLSAGAAYTYSKELVNGANGDTSYLTVSAPLINDVYNRAANKQISSLSHPNQLKINFQYTTPKINSDSVGLKLLSGAVHDWTIGSFLVYQSGDLIRVPASNNGLLTQLDRGPSNNPAVWGGGNTFWNINPGQSFLAKDPNCRCFDPTKDLVLNKAAWTDAAPGTFSQTAPYYNSYRWQRQPSEALNFGRNFRMGPKERNVVLNLRAEFQNVFNRLFLSSPSPTNPAAITTSNAAGLTGGYGFVNYINGAGARPRSGQIVAKLTF
jgi:hypothetical protein